MVQNRLTLPTTCELLQLAIHNNYFSIFTIINDTTYTVEPLNNGHGGDEHFVHCSEVVPSSEVEMYGQLMAGASSLSIVLLSEWPLSEVLL